MPLSPYATKPYCLDSEFLPRNLLYKGIDGLSKSIEEERGKAAYREFIRSLIFSPQVVIGRESTTGHPILAEAVKTNSERDALIKLFQMDRVYILLMVSRGRKGDRYQERSLLDFYEHSTFRGQDNADAVKGWTALAKTIGDACIPYVTLDPDQSLTMENRFTNYFTLPPDHPSVNRGFGDSLGHEPNANEITDLQEFWKRDLKQFVRWREDNNHYTLYRSTIYDEYIRPKSQSEYLGSLNPSIVAELEARRRRLRIPFKLMTDLAYNANVPATLNIKSFVPPDMPDPSSLPMHLFQATQFYNPELDAHRNAVRQVYSNLLESRIKASDRFFYDSQTFEQLPDIGSFTLVDALDVMGWPEWQSFKNCQFAALRFQNAEELEGLMREYWIAIKALHTRLESEAKQRSHWRRVGNTAVHLSIAITAHIMGHALLPDMMHSVPWWQMVAAATTVAQPLQAGLDIIVHGVAKGSNSLLTEIGFKDGGMREFTISQEMRNKLTDLRVEEEQLSIERRKEDAIIANASNRIATEG